MSPSELLKETERAAGESDLLASHDTLIRLKSAEKKEMEVFST
jgi:hypothetical protein